MVSHVRSSHSQKSLQGLLLLLHLLLRVLTCREVESAKVTKRVIWMEYIEAMWVEVWQQHRRIVVLLSSTYHSRYKLEKRWPFVYLQVLLYRCKVTDLC